MARKQSMIMEYQALTKARIEDLKVLATDAEKTFTQATKEIERLEKSMPAKRPYKKRAKAKAAPTPSEPKAETKRQAAPAGQKPRVTGTFGTGFKMPPPSPVRAPEEPTAQ